MYNVFGRYVFDPLQGPPLPTTDQALRAELRGLGFVKVEGRYSGHNDEGNFNDLDAVKADGTRVSSWDLRGINPVKGEFDTFSLRDRLDQSVNDLLPRGWEINGGGQGSVAGDLVADKVNLDHQYGYDEWR